VNEDLASVGLILKQVVETVPVSHLNVDPKFLNKLKCHPNKHVLNVRTCRMLSNCRLKESGLFKT